MAIQHESVIKVLWKYVGCGITIHDCKLPGRISGNTFPIIS